MAAPMPRLAPVTRTLWSSGTDIGRGAWAGLAGKTRALVGRGEEGGAPQGASAAGCHLSRAGGR